MYANDANILNSIMVKKALSTKYNYLDLVDLFRRCRKVNSHTYEIKILHELKQTILTVI